MECVLVGEALAIGRLSAEALRPSNANVIGVTQEQQDASQGLKPLKPGNQVQSVSAAAAGVSQFFAEMRVD